MKLKTIAFSAIAIMAAAAATAHVVVKNYSVDMKNIYAVRMNGTNYSVKDEDCKNMFGQFRGQTVAGTFKIYPHQNTSTGTLDFQGHTIPLKAVKMGAKTWGYTTDVLPAPLSMQHIKKIIMHPGTSNDDTRAEIHLVPTPEHFICIASTQNVNQ